MKAHLYEPLSLPSVGLQRGHCEIQYGGKPNPSPRHPGIAELMVLHLNGEVVGKCSLCGGVVSKPNVWHGVQRPVAKCESCGAVEDVTHNLPTVPMKRPQ